MFPSQPLDGRDADAVTLSYRLHRAAYPALVPGEGVAGGLLLVGLTTHEWRTVDAFENDLYQLHRLSLDNDRSGWAYVCQNNAHVLAHGWDAANFADRDLASYVKLCREWREWFEAQAKSSTD